MRWAAQWRHGEQRREAAADRGIRGKRDDEGGVLRQARHRGEHAGLLAFETEAETGAGCDCPATVRAGIHADAGKRAAHRKLVELRGSRHDAIDSRGGGVRCLGLGWPPRFTSRWKPSTCAKASKVCMGWCAISWGGIR